MLLQPRCNSPKVQFDVFEERSKEFTRAIFDQICFNSSVCFQFIIFSTRTIYYHSNRLIRLCCSSASSLNYLIQKKSMSNTFYYLFSRFRCVSISHWVRCRIVGAFEIRWECVFSIRRSVCRLIAFIIIMNPHLEFDCFHLKHRNF